MPIDYSTSTSTATVYAQATRLACEVTEDPTSCWGALMRVYGGRKRKIDGLPSWCPDFSNAGEEDDVVSYAGGPELSERVLEAYKSYAWKEFPVDTNTLIVSGFRLDHVDEVVSDPDILKFAEAYAILDPNTDIDDATFCKIFGANQLKWLNDMESLSAARGNDTAVTGGWPNRFLFDPSDEASFDGFKSGLVKVKMFCAFMAAHGITSSATACAEFGMDEAALQQMLKYIRSILIQQCGRHMFRTSSGRLGYAPLPVSPGDSICFIPNGMVLHVLSPDCTRHVAVAYVEGFMGDDLLKIVPTDKSQWEEFHLS